MTAPARGQPEEREPRSVVLLWNPHRGGWSRERHTEFAQHIIEFGSQVDNWSTGARKSGIARGYCAYLLRVGSVPRGIIGSGRFLGEVFQAPHWSAARSDPANIIEIDWDVLLTPDQVLPLGTARVIARLAAIHPGQRLSAAAAGGQRPRITLELPPAHQRLSAPGCCVGLVRPAHSGTGAGLQSSALADRDLPADPAALAD